MNHAMTRHENPSCAATSGGAPQDTPSGTPAPRSSPGDEAPPGTPGTGEALCRECGGTGRDRQGATCPVCGGTGKVTAGIGGG